MRLHSHCWHKTGKTREVFDSDHNRFGRIYITQHEYACCKCPKTTWNWDASDRFMVT